jgi:hypothetical protein
MHSVRPARVNVARRTNLDAIWDTRVGVREHSAIRELLCHRVDVVLVTAGRARVSTSVLQTQRAHAHRPCARLVYTKEAAGSAHAGDERRCAVSKESKIIWAEDLVCDDMALARGGIEVVDVAWHEGRRAKVVQPSIAMRSVNMASAGRDWARTDHTCTHGGSVKKIAPEVGCTLAPLSELNWRPRKLSSSTVAL